MFSKLNNVFGLTVKKQLSSTKSPGRKRRTNRLGACRFETLEDRALMSADPILTPVAPAPVTQYYNPAHVAPAADGMSAGITNFSAKAVSPTQVNLTWSGGDGGQGAYVCELIKGQWMEIGYTSDPKGFSVTGLQPGTTYEFKLGDHYALTQPDLDYSNTQSVTTNGAPTGSPVVHPTVLPAPVLTGSASTPSAANLSWNPVSGAQKYEVQQLNASNDTWVTLGTTTGTTYAVQHLSAASYNLFRVAAVGAEGPGAFSNSENVLTRPASPTHVVATPVSTSQINISWAAAPGSQYYVVAYKTPQSGWMYDTVPAGQTSLAVPKLSAGVSYTFEIGAYNASGGSYSSPISTATQAQASRPAAPANFSIKALNSSDTQVQLAWSPVAGATSYNIYLYTNSGWQVYTNTKATNLNLNLTAGYTYSFYVSALNAAGTGPGSAYSTVKPI